MKTVAIDCRFAHMPVGIGRYTRELVLHLLKRPDDLRYALIVLPEGEAWARSLPSSPTILTVKARHYSFREQWELPLLLRRERPGVFFAPHFNLPLFCPVSAVVTIHDLILHRFPNRASRLRQAAYAFLFHRSIRRAKRIIAVSAFTASELASLYGDDIARKTNVILEGVSDEFHPRSVEEQEDVLEKYGIRRPFFLYVGNAKEHKNVQMLIEAFGRLPASSTQLVLVTGGKEVGALRWRDGVRLLSHVEDRDLPPLYSAATAFVTASLYEGFGLSVAEAAACGCPVIATNATAIPEVAPPGSLLLPPQAVAFAEAMRNPPSPSMSPKKFSWEKAAEETVRVLQSTL